MTAVYVAVVWKFLVPAEPGVYTAHAPSGARFLTAALQGLNDERIALWALVDPSQERQPREIAVVFTGQEFNPHRRAYVGTVTRNGYVMHVFIETEATS